MASIFRTLSVALFFASLLFAGTASSADSPELSPSLAPQLPPEDTSPSPSPSPALALSPPAPPPSDLAPTSSSPAPSPGDDDADSQNSPSPAPAEVGDINRADQSNAGDVEAKDESSGGMSGGKKAGIAIGVIGAACVAGVGVLVYKKRQQNIQRSQYGHAARREFL
ncbi:hypothetical protein BUALT_Bualt02G0046900 [Buddleja alternifolia]|uniref:Uncharacterized protein n=1 Tax=Buddleja alternifolia TaxID=168488 RepID=A0AAV6XYV4_9LAMI|nr:hypothetical protein BUALT_Bualt02G0046900 [Buddleja alternifolia]